MRSQERDKERDRIVGLRMDGCSKQNRTRFRDQHGKRNEEENKTPIAINRPRHRTEINANRFTERVQFDIV